MTRLGGCKHEARRIEAFRRADHGVGTVELPPRRRAGGFDHASVRRAADRLYLAHTANDSVEVVDLARRRHEATLEGFESDGGSVASVEAASGRVVAQVALAGGPDVDGA